MVGLTFENHDGVVVGVVDIEKYLKLLLQNNSSIITGSQCILLLEYTDQAPWLKWSRHFTGITTTRVKVVYTKNSLSLVITAAAYLGSDYATQQKCLGNLMFKLKEFKSVSISGNNPLDIHLRSSADGKQRRITTGTSSAKSSYPIPDAPEHSNQLGDMTIACNMPLVKFVIQHKLKNSFIDGLKENLPQKRTEGILLSHIWEGRDCPAFLS